MAENPIVDAPNFGKLLGPWIARVPAPSMPRFLARLERGAADRYRAWAAALPDHAEVLLECAASEEQIAIRAEALYPAIPEHLASIEEALPGARDAYFEVFDGLSLKQQLALQAAAERQGAMAWTGLAEAEGLSDAHREELAALSTLELQSAARIDEIVEKL